MLTLSACASSSSKIDATYVSPLKYSSYNCKQMEEEYARVLSKSVTVNKQQDDTATNDSVAMGVGLILLWPALLFIDTDDKKEEVAQLKGELDAIEQSAIQKECSKLSQTMQDDRRLAAEAAKKRREELSQKPDS